MWKKTLGHYGSVTKKAIINVNYHLKANVIMSFS